MTNQEKKKRLRQYRDIVREIDCMESELATWYTQLERMTPTYTGMPSGSGSDDKMAIAMANIIALKDSINGKISERCAERRYIEAAIDSVKNARFRIILRRRYIDGWTLEQIASELHYDYRWIKRMHGIALSEVDM